MSYANVSIYPQSIRNADVLALISATSTTPQLLTTPGQNGTWIRAFFATSNETSTNHDIALYFQISSTNYLLSTFSLPINSGFTSGVVPVDVLRSLNLAPLPYDSCTNKVLWVPPNVLVYAGPNIAVSSGKTVTLTAFGEDF